MPRQTSTDPWRAVAHIATQAGDHGGVAWMLVLECGHLTARPQRRPRFPYNVKPFLAPKRVRCISCGLGTPPADPQVWIATFTQRSQP